MNVLERWQQLRGRRSTGAPAITPRWATTTERLHYLVFGLVGLVVAQWVLSLVGAGWSAPRWYSWADAWICVDVVGVPLLVHSHFYPSAVLYAVYACLVLYGFFVWLRASRLEVPTVGAQPEQVTAP